MESYDVIIVGAGPAGLMAARELDKAGIDYLLIDAKKSLGYPMKCAEGISEDAFKEFFGNKKYPFVKNTVHYHKIIYKDLTRVLHARFLELDRPSWERWMGKGLKIRLDCRLEDMDIDDTGAILKTSQGIMNSRLVILCSGCNFHIQKKLGLEKRNPNIAIAYGFIYNNHGLDKD